MTEPNQPSRSAGRARVVYLGAALGVIPVGLIARHYRNELGLAPPIAFTTEYLGDTLWAVMFFFLFAALLVRWRSWALLLLTLTFTVGIEASQLYLGEPLKTLRAYPPTGFLLGSTFLWSDVICLIVGTLSAAALHQACGGLAGTERAARETERA